MYFSIGFYFFPNQLSVDVMAKFDHIKRHWQSDIQPENSLNSLGNFHLNETIREVFEWVSQMIGWDKKLTQISFRNWKPLSYQNSRFSRVIFFSLKSRFFPDKTTDDHREIAAHQESSLSVAFPMSPLEVQPGVICGQTLKSRANFRDVFRVQFLVAFPISPLEVVVVVVVVGPGFGRFIESLHRWCDKTINLPPPSASPGLDVYHQAKAVTANNGEMGMEFQRFSARGFPSQGPAGLLVVAGTPLPERCRETSTGWWDEGWWDEVLGKD